MEVARYKQRFRLICIHKTAAASEESSSMNRKSLALLIVSFLTLTASAFAQQTPADQGQPPNPTAPAYTPKFKGDPAHSDSEAAALAYMRVVIRAQNKFNKQYGHYATTLPELVHTGSFTKRMVNPTQGDYTASFKGKTDSYILTMTPNHMDADHRSFYADEDGKIHGDADNPADEKSPVIARG
jgi:hypothetical protein